MREHTNFRATQLERVLAEQGRKARWLAQEVGISESHLSRIVTGERRVSEALATRISKAIQTPLFLVFELSVESNRLPVGIAVA